MALLNYAKREINAKIVYYGPGLCGKTTNIQFIHRKLNPESRGKLLSLATQTDRTLFFDFLPVELGDIKGFKTRFHLYTVPGQVFYNATRKMVLKGVDGVVFVADSQKDMMDANLESFKNLRENLADYGLNLDEVPYVIQCNKRDLPGVVPLEEMERLLNPAKVPTFAASAMEGSGVLPTLTTVCKMVLRKIRTTQGFGSEEEAPGKEMGASYRALRKGADRMDPSARPQPPASPSPVAPPPQAPRPASVPARPTPPPVSSPAPPRPRPMAPLPDASPLVVESCGAGRVQGDTEMVVPLTLRKEGQLCLADLHLRLMLDQGRLLALVTKIEERK